MIAYKGFNENLVCTMGKGSFQYEVKKTYKEDHADCASRGFHCTEEPIEVLRWYPRKTDRYCIVRAGGDVHEDGNDRISCTELTVLREINIETLGALECEWLAEHPDRMESSFIKRETGYASKNDRIVIVRGKNPRAAGELGTTIFLLKEKKRDRTIEKIGAYRIDGKEYLPGQYYTVTGRRSKCEKKS